MSTWSRMTAARFAALVERVPAGARGFLTMQLALLPPCWALPFLRDPDGSGGIVVFLCSLGFALLSNGVASQVVVQLAEERRWQAGRATRLITPPLVLLAQLGLVLAMAARAEMTWALVALGVVAFPLGTALAVAAGSAQESWRITDPLPLREAA
ncbi:MAG: hypothetical protein H6741_04710 [Alphaproteobacteria bacterium]|nr:hypothetical protein [Alphaproteobacteria bacterium]MCB9792009.1 hypothetical protein [Alphaproteobacteria bacterium]